MDYASFLIRKTRLERDWSQEGLCKGICTPSYLSKIEQGKAAPSDEIIQLLFERLGLCWNSTVNGCSGETIETAYDLLFSMELDPLSALMEQPEWSRYETSPWGLDMLLISRMMHSVTPLEQDLELLMNPKQLALQRILQDRCEEAIQLYPCGYIYMCAGVACYERGDSPQAVEFLQQAASRAADEGRPWVMLHTRMILGGCYSIQLDVQSMERHYNIARRLARVLGSEEDLEVINYNRAATCMELGQYEEAMRYFETKRNSDSHLTLHKLAICCEKLGRVDDALEALDRADTLPDSSPEQVEGEMCRTVRLRLTTPSYLDSEAYGASLQKTFALCRKHRSVGYCLFHLPWMVEWYEHHRQYKQVASLLREFPRCMNLSALNK